MPFMDQKPYPTGQLNVGTLVSDVFLSLDTGLDPIRIDEHIPGGDFENDSSIILGGTVISKHDLAYQGTLIESISPHSGVHMLKIDDDILREQNKATILIDKKVAGLRFWMNLITDSNKWISDSNVTVSINNQPALKYDLSKPNPYSFSDGIPRQSSFFEVNLNLINHSAPILIEIINNKDSQLLTSDLTILLDDFSTNFVNTNRDGLFHIEQTGRRLPLKYYDFGNGFILGDTFELVDGTYLVRYFAKDEFGHLSATKAAQIRISSELLPRISDLTQTRVSSTSSKLSFSMERSKDFVAYIYGQSSCATIATSSAMGTRAIMSDGFFETSEVSPNDCFGIKLFDEYGNWSSMSNFAQ